jgi:hypothetical protein
MTEVECKLEVGAAQMESDEASTAINQEHPAIQGTEEEGDSPLEYGPETALMW